MVSKSVVRVSLLAALALHSSAIMADAGAARHTGAGIARRQAFHERQRAEREELELQGRKGAAEVLSQARPLETIKNAWGVRGGQPPATEENFRFWVAK